MAARLARLETPPLQRVWLLALGKAAVPMAATAVDTLLQRGLAPTGGIVVAPTPGRSPHPVMVFAQGNHPEPGPGSLSAAEALGKVASEVRAGDEAWVLLSGGTTSLIGAPEPGLTPADLSMLYSLLLGSGLDITAMNRIRKRFSRWGGGKLARALAPATVRVFIVSDVIGDDLASIGSGPCVPDPTSAGDIRLVLEGAGLWHRIPESARSLVVAAETGAIPETPKPGDPAFTRVTHELIASNRLALDAVAIKATQLGLSPVVHDSPISGEAAITGATLATALLHNCDRHFGPQPNCSEPSCWIWGGETTVTLGDGSEGLGGRCQELALAAANTLKDSPEGVVLLAAGTDGRDGPTDAAGAVVDNQTWRTIARAGRDPTRDLQAHDAYRALDAAGALLRPGLTGTNVMDVVIGVCLR